MLIDGQLYSLIAQLEEVLGSTSVSSHGIVRTVGMRSIVDWVKVSWFTSLCQLIINESRLLLNVAMIG